MHFCNAITITLYDQPHAHTITRSQHYNIIGHFLRLLTEQFSYTYVACVLQLVFKFLHRNWLVVDLGHLVVIITVWRLLLKLPPNNNMDNIVTLL